MQVYVSSVSVSEQVQSVGFWLLIAELLLLLLLLLWSQTGRTGFG